MVEALSVVDIRAERAAICSALGCIDKLGVPLRFVNDLRERLSKAHAREIELLRSWDQAAPTERRELDGMRRGWGPSSPTERERRRQDVAACMSALGIALGDLSVPEGEEIPEDAQAFLDEAYERMNRQYVKVVEIMHALVADPWEWPDIRAAEERGAARGRQAMQAAHDLLAGPADAGGPVAEAFQTLADALVEIPAP